MKAKMKQFTFILVSFYGLLISCSSCQLVSRDVQANDGKIVGGTETSIQNYPYQAYLVLKQNGTNKYYECGGSIATRSCILTAAHCLTGMSRLTTIIYNVNAHAREGKCLFLSQTSDATLQYGTVFRMESATIRVGSSNRSSGGSTYSSRMLIQHPNYNSTTSDYDVAVIKVFRRINIDGVNSSLVYTPNYSCAVPAGTNLTITGWGDTTEGGSDSETLRVTTVSAVSDEECKKTYPNLTPRMTCAGVPEGGRDTCQGDSGGPLVITGTRFQSGIVSYGNGCARPNTPGVYTNVCNRSIQKWINRMGCS